jgi:antirestriction protein
MTQLFAQPYDISAAGFFFETIDEYDRKSEKLRNAYGEPVEEFEIQFIDGEDIDCALFRALGVHQGDIAAYLEAVDMWEEHQKINVILAVGEAGYSFVLGKDDPDQFDIQIYEVESMKNLAEQFVEEGLFGEIPESLQFYIDYEAIARDLAMDYAEAVIASTNYIYRID